MSIDIRRFKEGESISLAIPDCILLDTSLTEDQRKKIIKAATSGGYLFKWGYLLEIRDETWTQWKFSLNDMHLYYLHLDHGLDMLSAEALKCLEYMEMPHYIKTLSGYPESAFVLRVAHAHAEQAREWISNVFINQYINIIIYRCRQKVGLASGVIRGYNNKKVIEE